MFRKKKTRINDENALAILRELLSVFMNNEGAKFGLSRNIRSKLYNLIELIGTKGTFGSRYIGITPFVDALKIIKLLKQNANKVAPEYLPRISKAESYIRKLAHGENDDIEISSESKKEEHNAKIADEAKHQFDKAIWKIRRRCASFLGRASLKPNKYLNHPEYQQPDTVREWSKELLEEHKSFNQHTDADIKTARYMLSVLTKIYRNDPRRKKWLKTLNGTLHEMFIEVSDVNVTISKRVRVLNSYAKRMENFKKRLMGYEKKEK